MPLAKKSFVAVFLTVVALTYSAALFAQQQEEEIPFLYPDPRTVGVHPYVMQPRPAGAVTPNRYAGISEQERLERIQFELLLRTLGEEPPEQPQCPLCIDDPMTPCRTCKMCVAGFPCEKTLCRHCIQPRSKNMKNSCDLTAGDEPCGTCDSCREHRSDPCEHADSGYGPRGEYNPHNEQRFLSVIPRPLLDSYNNNARKYPVYYNPAPYYRPTWNPSMFTAYARPYVHRYSCALCFRDPCGCNTPGLAGQVAYAYACKFCNRNPCACAAEICDVNKLMDPQGVAEAVAAERAAREGTVLQPATELGDETSLTPSDATPEGTGESSGGLFDDSSPTPSLPTSPTRPPVLDTPTGV